MGSCWAPKAGVRGGGSRTEEKFGSRQQAVGEDASGAAWASGPLPSFWERAVVLSSVFVLHGVSQQDLELGLQAERAELGVGGGAACIRGSQISQPDTLRPQLLHDSWAAH